MSEQRPFRVLGLQQIAIGALYKGALRRLWVDTLGVEGAALYVGSFGEWTRRGAPVEVGASGAEATRTRA